MKLRTLSKQKLADDFPRHERWDGFSGISFVFCLACRLVQLVRKTFEFWWWQKSQKVTVIEKESLPGQNGTSERERFVNKPELRHPEWNSYSSRCLIPSEDYEITLNEEHFAEDPFMWSILKRTNEQIKCWMFSRWMWINGKMIKNKTMVSHLYCGTHFISETFVYLSRL